MGTIVRDMETDEVLHDFNVDGERVVIAKGGRGGHGNTHFKSSTNRAPRRFEEGTPGETKTLFLELKLMADVGLIGYPNAGKSTLISRISAARPKIADYPFTTLHPNLGVVQAPDFHSFVVADIPGLIPGAHRGVGLGDQFLRHVERTGILVHMIDLASPEGRDPWSDFRQINFELKEYGHHLIEKEQIVALNKTDAYQGVKPVSDLVREFRAAGYPAFAVSAVTGEGVQDLLNALYSELKAKKGEMKTVSGTMES
jgi:GTP-binding protein